MNNTENIKDNNNFIHQIKIYNCITPQVKRRLALIPSANNPNRSKQMSTDNSIHIETEQSSEKEGHSLSLLTSAQLGTTSATKEREASEGTKLSPVTASKPLTSVQPSTVLATKEQGGDNRMGEDETSDFDNFIEEKFTLFDGTQDVKQWLRETEKKFHELKLNKYDRYLAVPLLVIDDAKYWYITIRNPINSFDDFYERMLIKFDKSMKPAVATIVSEITQTREIQTEKTDFESKRTRSLGRFKSLESHELPHPIHHSTTRFGTARKSVLPVESVATTAIAAEESDKSFGTARKSVLPIGSSHTDTMTCQPLVTFETTNISKLNELDQTAADLRKLVMGKMINNQKNVSGATGKNEEVGKWLVEVDKQFDNGDIQDSKLAYRKLEKYTQTGTQSIKNYYAEIIQIFKEPDPRMSEHEKLRYLFKNMKSSLQYEDPISQSQRRYVDQAINNEDEDSAVPSDDRYDQNNQSLKQTILNEYKPLCLEQSNVSQLGFSVSQLILNMSASRINNETKDMIIQQMCNVMEKACILPNAACYVENIRSGLGSNHLRQQFLADRMMMIKPKPIFLGFKFHRASGKKKQKLWKPCKAYYVPFKESLKQIIATPELQSIMERRLQQTKPTTTLKIDITDGSIGQEHPDLREPQNLKLHQVIIEFRYIEFRTLNVYKMASNDEITQKGKNERQKEYGIVTKSPLTKIERHDIFQQTGLDVMHVYLEGICRLHLRLLFQNIIDANLTTLSKLSNIVRDYAYPPPSSRPSSAFEIKDLSGLMPLTAAEMLTVCKHLPFVLNRLLNRDPSCIKQWFCFILLQDILSFMFASEYDDTSIKQLELLLKLYFKKFNEFYPRNAIPKLHFTTHLMNQVKCLGPPRYCCCFSFEKKHSFFKRLSTRNFKNLSWTLSSKHQEWQCSQFVNNEGHLSDKTFRKQHQIRHLKQVNSDNYPLDNKIDPSSPLFQATTSINIYGLRTKKIFGSVKYGTKTFRLETTIDETTEIDHLRNFLLKKCHVQSIDKSNENIQIQLFDRELQEFIEFESLCQLFPSSQEMFSSANMSVTSFKVTDHRQNDYILKETLNNSQELMETRVLDDAKDVDDMNDNENVQEIFESKESRKIDENKTKAGGEDRYRVRTKQYLPKILILPTIPKHIEDTIRNGKLASVMKHVINYYADFFLDYNVSCQAHYKRITKAFFEQCGLDAVIQRDLMTNFRTRLSQKLRKLRVAEIKTSNQRKQVDLDARLSVLPTDMTADECIHRLNEIHNNSVPETEAAEFQRLVIQSFQHRRLLITTGSTYTFDELSSLYGFMSDPLFIRVEFELLEKIAFGSAVRNVKMLIENTCLSFGKELSVTGEIEALKKLADFSRSSIPIVTAE
ncbi:unnamed protein product, partial [Didymodactylos carnosus]